MDRNSRGAPGPPARAFAEEEVVGGRYRILRFLAAGAMGEVYAVEDLSLGERVALKVIRPEVAATPRVLERFKRELRLARRVTHPNVCRVFDLGEHPGAADGPGARWLFLTMELLGGETLREYLARRGRLPPEEVLPLAEQMAAALEAAHGAQIIHRDFKSGNVMRVPTLAPGAPRVVVTDFGLALSELLEEDVAVSREGELLGSPAYMSPEQVEGEPLTPASDLYSFGVVLFELVTGRLPFVARTPVATALKRLREPPPSPRALVPTLDPLWEDVLLRCLARQPGERFSSVSELIAALRGKVRFTPPTPLEAPPSVARRALVVLAPRNLSGRGDVAWLSTALVELLSAELAMGGQVRPLSGESAARMRQELALPEQEGFAEDTLRRIRAWSGADLVLTGSYLVLGREEAALLRLGLRLQDATTGESVAYVMVTGAERELLELVARAGAQLRERLGLTPPTYGQHRGRRHAMPTHPEAARLYAEGLAALRGHGAASAVERLEHVVAVEPTFAPAWSSLSAAFKQLYQEPRAREAARRAFELSAGLSREERLLVRARSHEARAEWSQAIEAYQTLFEFFPDDVEYGTALVSALVAAGRGREAEETLASLRHLPAPLGEDARIPLCAAKAATAASDFAACQRLAREAVLQAREVGRTQLAADALVHEAYAARNLGAPARAAELLEEAEQLFLAGGDRGGAARAMMVRAFALMDLGRLSAAEDCLGTAVRVARELQGASLVGEILTSASVLSCMLGDLDEALRRALDALASYERLELPADANNALLLLGMVRRYRGELDEAERLLEQAGQAAGERYGDEYIEAWARYELGCLLQERGELERARPQLERALALRRARGVRLFVAESELSLARLCLEGGHVEEALVRVERALLSQREVLGGSEQEALVHAVRTRVLLAHGEPSRAREALGCARALAEGSENVLIQSEVALAGAELVLRAGTPEEREVEVWRLQELIARGARGGLRKVELAARLVLAELSPAAGELHAVEREATRLGYLGLARRAGAAAR